MHKKVFDKIQHLFMLKTLRQRGAEKNFLNLKKTFTETYSQCGTSW